MSRPQSKSNSSPSRTFRTIAPVASMPNSNVVNPYTGSYNPPRRAKRPRSEGSDGVAPVPRPTGKPPRIDDTEYTPGIDAGVQPNKPRKSGMTRAAREAQRKINHSLIEKARRTKINEALAALKALVPSEPKGDDADEDNSGGKKKEDREFKLEILIKTVTYLEDLTAKVKALEANSCPHCGKAGGSSLGLKRKRAEEEDHEHPEENQDTEPTEDDTVVVTKSRPFPSPPFELPSISSWLGNPTVDPSKLRFPASPTRSGETSAMQLPSPPPSSGLNADTNVPAPPTLSLPPPNPFNIAHRVPASKPAHLLISPRSVATHGSSVSPPFRTPEDENAASLLLQISSPSSRDNAGSRKTFSEDTMQAQTPSSLLGLLRK